MIASSDIFYLGLDNYTLKSKDVKRCELVSVDFQYVKCEPEEPF